MVAISPDSSIIASQKSTIIRFVCPSESVASTCEKAISKILKRRIRVSILFRTNSLNVVSAIFPIIIIFYKYDSKKSSDCRTSPARLLGFHSIKISIISTGVPSAH